MFLERLEIRNYRCFDNVDLQFPEAGLVLVIGRNNVGKSALLRAIDELFAKQATGAGTRDPARPGSVLGTFQLDPKERELFIGNGKDHEIDPEVPIRLRRISRGMTGAIKAEEWMAVIPVLNTRARKNEPSPWASSRFRGQPKR